MRFLMPYIAALFFSTFLSAAEVCPSTSTPLFSGVPEVQYGSLSDTDPVDYFQFSVPAADPGTVKIVYQAYERITFEVSKTGCDGNEVANINNQIGDVVTTTVVGGETIFVKVSRNNKNTSYNFSVTFQSNNTPPVVPSPHPPMSVDENATNGTVVGTVVADDSDTLTYSIVGGNSSGVFGINASTGVITVVDNSTLSYNTTPFYDLVVDVSDTYVNTVTTTIRINVIPETNVPPVVYPDTFYLSQDASSGAIVGTVRAVDSVNDTLTYSISAGIFSIDSTTGVITLTGTIDPSASPYTPTVTVTDSYGASTDTTITVIITSCPYVNDFLTIDGSETVLTGHSTKESIADEGNYYKFNATGTAGDINGTLKISAYSTNALQNFSAEILDAQCQPIADANFSVTDAVTFLTAEFLNEPAIRYLHLTTEENPQTVVSMLWYPDANLTYGGSSYPPTYNEPAIFVAADTIDGSTISTRVVNKPEGVTIRVVNADGLYTDYDGNFMLELIDNSEFETAGCKNSEASEFLGMQAVQDGSSTPEITFPTAKRDVMYRMTYLVEPSGGVINYEDLLNVNVCTQNTMNCLWGVLTSMATTGEDPYYPEFTIADVCGMYCDPGIAEGGAGNNQVSAECAACVFGNFGYSDCSDHFAIRPDHFEIDSENNSYPDLLRAGKGYDLNITAVQYGSTAGAPEYNQTGTQINPDLLVKYYGDGAVDTNNSIAGIPEISTNFDFVDGLTFVGGVHDTVPYRYSDVGDITLHLEDDDWTIVDAADTPNTCDEDGRKICGDKNVTFIPDHFAVTINDLHNNGANDSFTYLSGDANQTIMSARFDVSIIAQNELNGTTVNFTQPKFGHTYYENEVTVKLDLPTHTTLGNAKPHDINVSQLIEFNDGVKTISWNDSNESLLLTFNYPRTADKPVNPFIVYGTDARVDVNSTYYAAAAPIGAPEGIAYIDGTDDAGNSDKITFVYGRTHMARTRAMCTTLNDCTGSVNFYYEFYGDEDANATIINDLLTTPKRSLDSVNWYINTEHNTTTDGNVTNVTNSVPGGGTAWSNSPITYSTGTVNYDGSKGYPYKSTLDIYTWSWLIHDPFNPNPGLVTTGQLEYYGPGSWSSDAGADTSVKDDGTNRNQNSNRRIRW